MLQFNLPAGNYAVQVMHDENENNKLDTNFMGMPIEGYGFSNNPRRDAAKRISTRRVSSSGMRRASIVVRLR